MTMISYAANFQDVVLQRLFPVDYQGFYIDIGANDPVGGSVTKHFSDRGWRGINAEPGKVFERLQELRGNDINLNCGVSDQPGTLTFYDVVPYSGWSTFDREQAERYREKNQCTLVTTEIEVTTLTRICEQHDVGNIDFMSIDVEGHELAVLQGHDWQRYRPRVVVVEAIEPNSTVPTHQQWEYVLLDAEYTFALFDGINRFYVRNENSEDLQLLEAPANVLDDFISLQETNLRNHIEFLEAQLASPPQSPPTRKKRRLKKLVHSLFGRKAA